MSTKNITHLTLELTNRCNPKCKICNIWKEKEKKDLELSSIKRVIDSIDNPLNVALTGGEPLLHPRFDEIYRYLFKLYLKKKILNIDISTNAYSDKIKKFLIQNLSFLKPLSISISLDGFKDLHNKQRGKKDAFKNTLKNIQYIKKLGLPLEIKFVISPINYKDLLKVYIISKKIGAQFATKLVETNNPNYYHRKKELCNLNFKKEQLKKIEKDLTKIYNLEERAKKNELRTFALLWIIRFIKEGNLNFINRCLTPKYSLFITHDSKIYSCIYYPPIGKVNNKKIIIDNRMYKKILNEAEKGVCPKCLAYHGFLMGFNTNYEL